MGDTVGGNWSGDLLGATGDSKLLGEGTWFEQGNQEVERVVRVTRRLGKPYKRGLVSRNLTRNSVNLFFISFIHFG